MSQLIANELSFSHGPTPILSAVSLGVSPGDRVGVVGPNGVGKSTLLRVLAGELEPSAGSVTRHPPDTLVGYLTQELTTVDGESVRAFIGRRTGVDLAQRELDAATAALAQGRPGSDDRYAVALDRWLRLGAADLDARIDEQLAQVGLDGGLGDAVTSQLSGGQRARVGLAALLLSQFEIVLLDEPTNDLDRAGLDQLEAFIATTRAAVVLVSHDRRLLERVVTSVVELDEHTRSGTVYRGGWSSYLEDRAIARRHAEERHATYETERQRLTQRARRERSWATSGVAREKRQPRDNDKAQRDFRINRTEQLASRARRTEQALERLEVVDKPWQGWELRFSIGEIERPGDLVAELHEAEIARGSFRLGPVNLVVRAGDRVLVSGPNGSGKTTLINALLGELDLDSGTARLGPSVVVGRLDQDRHHFDAAAPLLDVFLGMLGCTITEARSTLAKFGLTADHVARPAAELSPGERTRAMLAAFQLRGVNLLVLDEPTNHLDLPAIEQLEQALGQFAGTLLLVSHDRAFVEGVSLSREVRVTDGRVEDGALS